MRCAAASHFKRRGPVLCERPRQGTRIRELYDLFMANRGVPIAIVVPRGRTFDDLVDYWGLDIVNLRRGEWVLAGEWFGRVYVDYIAERIAADNSEVSA